MLATLAALFVVINQSEQGQPQDTLMLAKNEETQLMAMQAQFELKRQNIYNQYVKKQIMWIYIPSCFIENCTFTQSV